MKHVAVTFMLALLGGAAVSPVFADPAAVIQQNKTTGAVSIQPPCTTAAACAASTANPIGTNTGAGFMLAPAALPLRPAFQASNGGNSQTASASGNTVLALGSAGINVGGFYAAGTSTWTPPAGNYHLDAAVMVAAGITDQGTFSCVVLKNGATILASQVSFSGTGVQSCQISGQVTASGTDGFQLRVGNLTGTALTIGGDAAQTFFGGHLL